MSDHGEWLEFDPVLGFKTQFEIENEVEKPREIERLRNTLLSVQFLKGCQEMDKDDAIQELVDTLPYLIQVKCNEKVDRLDEVERLASTLKVIYDRMYRYSVDDDDVLKTIDLLEENTEYEKIVCACCKHETYFRGRPSGTGAAWSFCAHCGYSTVEFEVEEYKDWYLHGELQWQKEYLTSHAQWIGDSLKQKGFSVSP